MQLGAIMSKALSTSNDPDTGAEILLSAVLPHAYQLEVGPVLKARPPRGRRMHACAGFSRLAVTGCARVHAATSAADPLAAAAPG